MAQKFSSRFKSTQPSQAERKREKRHKEILETSSRRRRVEEEEADWYQSMNYDDDTDAASAALIARLSMSDALEVEAHDHRIAEYIDMHGYMPPESQVLFQPPSLVIGDRSGARPQPQVQAEASTSARPATPPPRTRQVKQARSSASRAAAPKRRNCVVCMNTFESRRMISTSCGPPCHWLCEVCTKEGVGLAIKDEADFPLTCCQKPIEFDFFKHLLNAKERAAYLLRQEEKSAGENRIYCSKKACGAYVPKMNVIRNIATCKICKTRTCTLCKQREHGEEECPPDEALLAALQLIRQEGWKRCPSCQAGIELRDGCNHITVRSPILVFFG